MVDNIEFDFKKETYSSIRQIENFNKENVLRIEKSSSTEKNIFVLNKEENKLPIGKIYENQSILKLSELKNKYFAEDGYIVLRNSHQSFLLNYSDCLTANFRLSIPQTISLSINAIKTNFDEAFNDKYLRLLIPVSSRLNISELTSKSVRIDSTIIFNSIVEVSIFGKSFHIFSVDTYLIIESQEPINFKIFKDVCGAILLSLGFITGNFLQNEFYFQCSLDKNFVKINDMAYEKKQDSIITNSSIFDRGRFRDYIQEIGKIEVYQKYISYFPMQNLSKLCETILINSDFRHCCQFTIEGNSSNHKLSQAGIYSIALETITNIVYKEHSEKINPIPEKSLAKTVSSKLISGLEEFTTMIPEEKIEILRNKLRNINAPTAGEKLSKPFDIYGINLSNEQKEILKFRNKFLHGTIPLSIENTNYEYDLSVIISHFKFLLNCLILKYIGYRGHIINNPAVLDYNLKKDLSDHLFKII